MTGIEYIFWIFAFFVFYTYLGYGVVLGILVWLKDHICPEPKLSLSVESELPEMTLFVCAYNEELVVDEKMSNTRSLNYPKGKLKILWVTDGSTDKTNQLLARYPEVRVAYDPLRGGKSAALNRGIQFVQTPLVVFTDANAMIGENSLLEIARLFLNPKVGCVAGEKRVNQEGAQSAGATEGIYWKYESKLKEWDYRLYSAVGAAGELFAMRTVLYTELPKDSLLDDFILSLRIAMQGYRVGYSSEAYAFENASANMQEEAKRKKRIAAGGLQSIARLLPLFNLFKYGVLSWQYVSHRVLRWTITPFLLLLLLPLNVILLWSDSIGL
ncbi:MAG: glycosyltransferase family 2 protein, partial [Bacteroidaceae bacterium]